MQAEPVPSFAADCEPNGRLRFDLPAQVTAYCRATCAGQRVDVEIRPRKGRRSDRQNRAFWAALTPWAKGLGYTAVELKDELLGLLWGTEAYVSRLTGETLRRPVKGHSSRLTMGEFSELFEFMVLKAAEMGYVMPLPEEFRLSRAG